MEDEINKITFTRKFSGIYSRQGDQGTCYAHAASRVFSRIVKVIFSPFFVKEDERCDWLYDTDFLYTKQTYTRNGVAEEYNGVDIDKYLIEKNGKSIWEICNNEILSNLLFLFFYSISIKKFGCVEGYAHSSLKLFIETIEIYGSIKNELEYKRVVEDIIYTVGLKINRVKGVQKKFLESCFNLLAILLISMGKLMIKDIELVSHCKFANKDYNLESFLNVLKDGYYAILSIKGKRNHVITVVDYIKDVSGKIDLIVKNSWGKERRGFGAGIGIKINSIGIIEDFKFNEDYNFIYFIHPSFKIDITRDYIINFVKEQILLLNPELLLELRSLNPIDPPIEPQIEHVDSIIPIQEPRPPSNPRPRNTLRSLRKSAARLTGIHNASRRVSQIFGLGGIKRKCKNIKTKRKKR